MSDLICPHCGEANALDAQTCISCHKSLYTEPAHPFQGAGDDEMEWLKNYRSFGSDDNTTENDDDDSQEANSDSDETEIPGWLARIRARKSDELPAEPIEESRQEEPFSSTGSSPGVTDWLKNIQELEAKQAERDEAEKQGFPDWLSRIAQRKAEDSEPDSPDGSYSNSTFLTGNNAQIQNSIEGLQTFRDQPAGEMEEPSNIEGFDSEGFVDLPPDLFGEAQQPITENDDFNKFDAREESAAEKAQEIHEFFPVEPPLKEKLASDEPIHDLEQLMSVQNPSSAGDHYEDSDAENLDGGLSLPEGEFGEEVDHTSNPAEQPAQTNQLPDWLFSSEEDQPQAEKTVSSFDIFRESSPLPPESSRAGFVNYAEESVPDWLKESESTPSSGIAAEKTDEEAASGMPDWLQSMQPIGSQDQKRNVEYQGKIEGAGPLAGYQGILPGSLAATHYSKPPIYSDNLHVTDKQRIYATLFDTLIADEKKAEEIAEEKSKVPAQVLRIVVGLLLIGVVGIALIFNANLGIQPALFPSENVAFFTTMQSLSDAAAAPRILVGIDYDAALAGELAIAASPVVQDLMANSSDLVFISLNTSGPALAENLISRAASSLTDYRPAEHVVNLGYLPGSAAALAGLAISPQQSAPRTVDGGQAWEKPSLQKIDKIADFDAVLLLTDNTESARDWIEQVQSTLEGEPFLVVSSAQAAPGLQPYVHSGQVTGMLAGLSGRASYQNLNQANDDAYTGYWDAHQIGMLLITALILTGAIVFSIKNLFSAGKKA